MPTIALRNDADKQAIVTTTARYNARLLADAAMR
jgi:hypothetical protein